MRLLNASTLKFETFTDERVAPDYAILSHTWGDDEVQYDQVRGGLLDANLDECNKIRKSCLEALKDGLYYVWVDTCCIDKSSSAELSEAINSMFKWYQRAAICYAYLADVSLGPNSDYHDADERTYLTKAIRNSRWFKRGWTLQELLAPTRRRFYNRSWQVLGVIEVDRSSTEADISADVSAAARIPIAVIKHRTSLRMVSIARRMSWASGRETTRIEDEAYCLLGVFDVNMPMLYGEGSKAFRRLQEQIIRQSTDHSILAWSYVGSISDSPLDDPGLLAYSPACFANAEHFIPRLLVRDNQSGDYEMTNQGLRILINILILHDGAIAAVLNCAHARYPNKLVTLPLHNNAANWNHDQQTSGVMLRKKDYGKPIDRLMFVDLDARILRQLAHRRPQQITIMRDHGVQQAEQARGVVIRLGSPISPLLQGLTYLGILHYYPISDWDSNTHTTNFGSDRLFPHARAIYLDSKGDRGIGAILIVWRDQSSMPHCNISVVQSTVDSFHKSQVRTLINSGWFYRGREAADQHRFGSSAAPHIVNVSFTTRLRIAVHSEPIGLDPNGYVITITRELNWSSTLSALARTPGAFLPAVYLWLGVTVSLLTIRLLLRHIPELDWLPILLSSPVLVALIGHYERDLDVQGMTHDLHESCLSAWNMCWNMAPSIQIRKPEQTISQVPAY